MKGKIPILLYHDLDSVDYSTEKTNLASKDTVVSAVNFNLQMKWLKQNGYHTITIKEFGSLKPNPDSIFKKKIIITFDDGHISNYQLAYPILKKYGFKASFFIVTNWIDRKDYLSTQQIKEMHDCKMEIGSHGLSHSYLNTLDANRIKNEVQKSRKKLEIITKQPVEFFAYPGGHYNKQVLEQVNIAGYKGACSCLQGLNTLKTNPYLLKRLEIRKKMSLNNFQTLFQTHYLLIYQGIDLIKGLFRRFVGLKKYSEIRKRFYKYYILKR